MKNRLFMTAVVAASLALGACAPSQSGGGSSATPEEAAESSTAPESMDAAPAESQVEYDY